MDIEQQSQQQQHSNNNDHNTNTAEEPTYITSYYGVDLTAYNVCHVEASDERLAGYSESDVHFGITALQKGLKPPTKIGIKRTKRRNFEKKRNIELRQEQEKISQNKMKDEKEEKDDLLYVKPLNPKSPEENCIKAIRREVKAKIDEGRKLENQGGEDKKVVKTTQQRKMKFIRKKENQKLRRIELFNMFRENKPALVQIFPKDRLEGYNSKCKCPKISRKEMKEALDKFYNDNPEEKRNMEKRKKEFEAKKLKRELLWHGGKKRNRNLWPLLNNRTGNYHHLKKMHIKN